MLVGEARRWCTRLFFIILKYHSTYAQMGFVEADQLSSCWGILRGLGLSARCAEGR